MGSILVQDTVDFPPPYLRHTMRLLTESDRDDTLGLCLRRTMRLSAGSDSADMNSKE